MTNFSPQNIITTATNISWWWWSLFNSGEDFIKT